MRIAPSGCGPAAVELEDLLEAGPVAQVAGGDAAEGVARLHRVGGTGRGGRGRQGIRRRGGRGRRLLVADRLFGDDGRAGQGRSGQQRSAADTEDGGHEQAGQLLGGGQAG